MARNEKNINQTRRRLFFNGKESLAISLFFVM